MNELKKFKIDLAHLPTTKFMTYLWEEIGGNKFVKVSTVGKRNLCLITSFDVTSVTFPETTKIDTYNGVGYISRKSLRYAAEHNIYVMTNDNKKIMLLFTGRFQP